MGKLRSRRASPLRNPFLPFLPPPPMLLGKYGEIALKSASVRRRFERQLIHNIENALMSHRVEASVEEDRGVLYIRTNHTEKVEEVLAHTFGVIYYSEATETSSRWEDIEPEAARLASSFPPQTSFAVRCKRAGTHPYTSMELAARLGEVILEAYPEKEFQVDLMDPDNTLWAEVRNDKCHMYVEKKRGPGGMPVCTQGRALLSVPRGMEDEAAVAGWSVMKRGVRLFVMPEEGAEDIVPRLRPWGGPERSVRGEGSLQEILRGTGSRALVLVDREPEEMDLEPPLAVLYPLAGMEEERYERIIAFINGG